MDALRTHNQSSPAAHPCSWCEALPGDPCVLVLADRCDCQMLGHPLPWHHGPRRALAAEVAA